MLSQLQIPRNALWVHTGRVGSLRTALALYTAKQALHRGNVLYCTGEHTASYIYQRCGLEVGPQRTGFFFSMNGSDIQNHHPIVMSPHDGLIIVDITGSHNFHHLKEWLLRRQNLTMMIILQSQRRAIGQLREHPIDDRHLRNIDVATVGTANALDQTLEIRILKHRSGIFGNNDSLFVDLSDLSGEIEPPEPPFPDELRPNRYKVLTHD